MSRYFKLILTIVRGDASTFEKNIEPQFTELPYRNMATIYVEVHLQYRGTRAQMLQRDLGNQKGKESSELTTRLVVGDLKGLGLMFLNALESVYLLQNGCKALWCLADPSVSVLYQPTTTGAMKPNSVLIHRYRSLH